MTSKTLFNKQKELRDQLNAVVKQEWFQKCLIYVRGELMEHANLTPAGIDGAKAFESILLGFTDEEPPQGDFPGVGLEHNLEPTRKLKPKSETQ
jgi:hypothetical protein